MNQVIKLRTGDHGTQLQLGILYLFAMASSMNQVNRPWDGDHGILLQHGTFVFVWHGQQCERGY